MKTSSEKSTFDDGKPSMMQLNQDDQQWLENFRSTLDFQYPNLVDEIMIFGSKARGDDREDSDLDVLLTIREGDWKLKWEIEGLGYELAVGSKTVPTIMILTEKEKEEMLNRRSSFLETLQREGETVR